MICEGQVQQNDIAVLSILSQEELENHLSWSHYAALWNVSWLIAAQ
jgi:hypothetical protein